MKPFKIALSTLLFLTSMCVYAQQLPEYAHYVNNPFLINPAVAGTQNYLPVYLTSRRQWLGFGQGAPATSILSAHKRNDNTALGGYIFNDRSGNVNRSGLNLSYAFHAKITESTTLSFGLAGSMCQYTHDQSDYQNIEVNDPALSHTKVTTFIPNADAGVYLYNEKFFAGLSSMQLFKTKIILGSNDAGNNFFVRHYFLNAGYNYEVNAGLVLQPSVLMKSSDMKNNEVDMNLKATLNDAWFAGLSYRTSSDVSVFAGVYYKNFVFGYAFDYAMSSLSKHSNGTHEILLGIDIGKNQSVSKY